MKVTVDEAVMEESLTCRQDTRDRSHGICRTCPMAIAINKLFGLTLGQGWTDGLHWGISSTGNAFMLPKDVQKWVGQYDTWYVATFIPECLPSNLRDAEHPRPQVPVEFDL